MTRLQSYTLPLSLTPWNFRIYICWTRRTRRLYSFENTRNSWIFIELIAQWQATEISTTFHNENITTEDIKEKTYFEQYFASTFELLQRRTWPAKILPATSSYRGRFYETENKFIARHKSPPTWQRAFAYLNARWSKMVSHRRKQDRIPAEVTFAEHDSSFSRAIIFADKMNFYRLLISAKITQLLNNSVKLLKLRSKSFRMISTFQSRFLTLLLQRSF